MGGQIMVELSQAVTPEVTASTRSKFYPIMAGLILLIVLVGFGPTLYLRPLFDVQKHTPPYLYVHGIVLTAWFVLFFLQTLLVVKDSTARHRELGIAGVAIGAVIPLAGLMATLGLPGHYVTLGADLEARVPMWTGVIFQNFRSVTFFSAALIGAFVLRRKRDFHSRLMLWATISILGPAITRLPLIDEGNLDRTVLYLLMAVIVVHELWRERRMHVVTAIALSAWISWWLVEPLILDSQWAQDFVRSLA